MRPLFEPLRKTGLNKLLWVRQEMRFNLMTLGRGKGFFSADFSEESGQMGAFTCTYLLRFFFIVPKSRHGRNC